MLAPPKATQRQGKGNQMALRIATDFEYPVVDHFPEDA
jgi:hypothetical protein